MNKHCETCGQVTEASKDEYSKQVANNLRNNPIYGTDLNRPMSEIITEIRERMCGLRGSITDFQFGYPAWKGRTAHVEGLLTCGIIALYDALKEIKEFEAENETKHDRQT